MGQIPNNWWLISADDVQTLMLALASMMRDTDVARSQQAARDALHTLTAGLHQTNAVPDDFRSRKFRPLPDEKPDVETGHL